MAKEEMRDTTQFGEDEQVGDAARYLRADRSAGMGQTGMAPDVDISDPNRDTAAGGQHARDLDTGGVGGRQDAEFVERSGNMGAPHNPGVGGDRGVAAGSHTSDGTALPQTDPAMTGIDTENANVNDADAGDSRLIDPGNRNP